MACAAQKTCHTQCFTRLLHHSSAFDNRAFACSCALVDCALRVYNTIMITLIDGSLNKPACNVYGLTKITTAWRVAC